MVDIEVFCSRDLKASIRFALTEALKTCPVKRVIFHDADVGGINSWTNEPLIQIASTDTYDTQRVIKALRGNAIFDPFEFRVLVVQGYYPKREPNRQPE